MKVEEYVREVEQLRIRCALREEPEQSITRFVNGSNPTILGRVELQPFWTFEDACKLAVKVEKQLKSRRNYLAALAKPTAPVKTFNSFRPNPHPKEKRER